MIHLNKGWCDGAGLTSSAGASYNSDYSRARAYCACNRRGWGLFGIFYSHLSFLSSFSLTFGDGPIETEILSQRAVKPKLINQPMLLNTMNNDSKLNTPLI